MLKVTVPEQRWIDLVGPVDGVDLQVWDMSGPLADPVGVTFVVSPYQVTSAGYDNLASATDATAFQLLSAGYEHALPFLQPGMELANARGVHDSATAELAATLILAAQRRLPDYLESEGERRWDDRRFEPGLADKKVMIIGYGEIGQAIARRLLPFETTLTAVASRDRDGDELVDHIHALDDVDTLLPEQDVVVLIVPLTDATERLVDADFLARMKKGALLVNVARGRVVDTDALVDAVASGHVRAALDVTDPEPLPDGHPLLALDGVLEVPHLGGLTDAFAPRAARLIRSQLERLARGESLEHVVATGTTS
ncbi:2-hydroxyacid dehydrogenase [Arsenicicoccus piscis]|uniref:2-hydroxyacid dehydrogenase n=1 Tax=Arsenicicoccus piscis TaxID=673954 RepID=UPI001F4CBEFD|nr:2-hydroxyacid dehydrogenase [Arsenicicoccus piscis]